MTQQASTQGFQGSDTDGLDKIVNKMKEAAAFADKMVIALKALCAALDMMSWTGYAAALSAYIKGTVIPLLTAVSKNLKAFAGVVGLASSVQKDTSSNMLVIDAGDTGYVPVAIAGPAPAGTGQAAGVTVDSVTQPGQQAVESTALDTGKLSTVVQEVGTIVSKLGEFIESVDGDGVNDGSLSQSIGKLAELIAAIETLVGDDDAAGSDTGAGTDAGTEPDAGTDPGTGTDVGAGTDLGTGTGTGTDLGTGTDPGTSTGTGSSAGQTFTAGEIWQAVTGALRELGIVGPDGTVGGGGVGDGGLGGIDTGGVDTGGIDTGAAASQIDSIQASLDTLRETLGIESPAATDTPTFASDHGMEYGMDYGRDWTPTDFTATDPGLSFDTGATALGAPLAIDDFTSGTGGDTPVFEDSTGYDAGYDAGYQAGSTSTADPLSYAAESADTGTYDSAALSPASDAGSGDSGSGTAGSGAAGSGDSGSGSAGSGDSGSGGGGYQPEQQPAQGAAEPENQNETVYRAQQVGPVTPAATVADQGSVQTRLVAMADDSASQSSAAVPLTGAAVAASLLGGLYARRSRSEEDTPAGEEVYAAEPAPAS